jgi:hypothetical protein
MFLVSQDKTYYKGRFFVASGSHVKPGSLYLRVLNVSDLSIVAKVDLSAFGGEPQGLSVNGEGRLMLSYYYLPNLYYLNYDAGTTTNPFYLPVRR